MSSTFSLRIRFDLFDCIFFLWGTLKNFQGCKFYPNLAQCWLIHHKSLHKSIKLFSRGLENQALKIILDYREVRTREDLTFFSRPSTLFPHSFITRPLLHTRFYRNQVKSWLISCIISSGSPYRSANATYWVGCPKITPSVKCLAPEAFSGAKLQVLMENGQKNEID